MKKILITLLFCLTSSLIFAQNYYEKAVNAMKNDDYELCVTYLDILLESNPNDDFYHYFKGKALLYQDKYELAISSFTKAISLNSNNDYYYFHRGQVYYFLDEYQKAINDFNKSILINGNNSESYHYRGSAYYFLNNYNEAIKDYNKAISLDPNSSSSYYSRGLIFDTFEEYDKAIIDFTESIRLNPESFNSYYFRGCSFLEKNYIDEAINDFSSTINLNPNHALSFYKRGSVYLNYKFDYNMAINDITKAIQLNSNDANFFSSRGQAYSYINKNQLAIKDYTNAIELVIDDPDNYSSRGWQYIKINEYSKANQDFTKAIELQPYEVTNYFGRAKVNILVGKFSEAINDYSKSIDLATGWEIIRNSIRYRNRGALYYFLSDYKKAYFDFNTIVESNKSSEIKESYLIDYIYLGKIENHLNDVKKAEYYFNIVLRIDNFKTPKSVIALHYLNRKKEAESLAIKLLSDVSSKESDFINGVNYNYIDMILLARSFSLLNNEFLALNCLNKAFEWGFNDYWEIMIEDDFTNIRNSKKFATLLTNKNVLVPEYNIDTDVNIPVNLINNTNLYALIIGNEDYSSYNNMSNEINVKNANNDASVFRNYIIKTFGAPERNVILLLNATGTRIMQEVDKLSEIIKTLNGNAEIILYYAGHGLANQETKESYIIPVDIDGSNLNYAIKLQDVFNKLSEYPTKRTTVFLDACFSGGARNVGLLSMRAVKVRPKTNVLSNNFIVFTSSSDTEPSQSSDELRHGLFTYYMLKKIQETKGNVTYQELFKYLSETVPLEALHNKSQKQTPSILFSNDIIDKWENWKIVE